MKPVANHPCFECTLPDCDETSKACALRMALNRYDNCRRKKLPVTERIRRQYSIAWKELYGFAKREREALRRAEQVGS